MLRALGLHKKDKTANNSISVRVGLIFDGLEIVLEILRF